MSTNPQRPPYKTAAKKPQTNRPTYQTIPDESPEKPGKYLPIVVGVTVLAVVASILYNVVFKSATIELLKPSNGEEIAAKDLTFEWRCSKPDADLVLEVYEEGELVLRQFVTDSTAQKDNLQLSQNSFKPHLEQAVLLKPNTKYTWRVSPNPDRPQKYKFAELPYGTFYITSAIETTDKEAEASGGSQKPVEQAPPSETATPQPTTPKSTQSPSRVEFGPGIMPAF
ncbi:MAG: hypothetical protein RMM17_04000 [Acidobacteriota bacterium]|nr:hypothetical protein [Blastocatellia bacterium]MDW8411825.1 hypothetical protein [Acidobacteriota bacterium]